MTSPRHSHRFAALAVAFALVLLVVGAAVARGETASNPSVTTTTIVPAPETPAGVNGMFVELGP
jgi:hypothetical protein